MPTKTKPGKKNFVYLNVDSSSECMSDEYAMALVDLTPDYAKELLKKIEIVKGLKNKDNDVYELVYWDFRANYGTDEKELANPGFGGSPVECEQLIVHRNEVKWMAYIKHSDPPVEIRTDWVGEDFLKDRAAKKK